MTTARRPGDIGAGGRSRGRASCPGARSRAAPPAPAGDPRAAPWHAPRRSPRRTRRARSGAGWRRSPRGRARRAGAGGWWPAWSSAGASRCSHGRGRSRRAPKERAQGSVSSGNQARTLAAHSAWERGAPPGTRPASSARPTYLRTVLRSRPKARAIWETLSPACQCLSSSTTSTTANILLAIRAPSIDPADERALYARELETGGGEVFDAGGGELLDATPGELSDARGLQPGELIDRRQMVASEAG